MRNIIQVQPTPANRKAFARWAVSHRVRTQSSNTFAVPEHLLTEIPEELLHGAMVDGARMGSPDVDEAKLLGDGAPIELREEPSPEPASTPEVGIGAKITATAKATLSEPEPEPEPEPEAETQTEAESDDSQPTVPFVPPKLPTNPNPASSQAPF